MAGQRKIAFLANSCWNIVNYRLPLIYACEELGFHPVILAPKDEYAANIPNHWTCIFIKHLDPGGKNPLQDLRLYLELRQALSQASPTLLLGFTIKPNIYGGLAAAHLGILFIPTITGLGYSFLKKGWISRFTFSLYRIAFRKAHRVVFQNQDDLKLFVRQGLVDEKQCLIIPGSGVDTTHFSPSPLPDNPIFTFLFIGRLLWDKGIGELILAMQELQKRAIPVKCLLLGGVDQKNPAAITETEVRHWQQQGWIEWLETKADVRPFLEMADVLVLPSYREGLPRAVLEAMAMQKPVIVTNVPGCNALVKHQENGFLVTAKDPESLLIAMQNMMDLSPSKREEMGVLGRERVLKYFDIQIVVAKYLSLVQSF